MGFKDGTRNIKSDDHAGLADHVWVGKEADQPWMVDGSYLVARKIRMLVETWDVETLSGQEEVFGRAKDTGAPLGEDSEFATPDLDARRSGRLSVHAHDAPRAGDHHFHRASTPPRRRPAGRQRLRHHHVDIRAATRDRDNEGRDEGHQDAERQRLRRG